MKEPFKIDKGIPLDKERRKYPLPAMEVGDSFFVAGGSSQTIGGSFAAQRPKKFAVRTVTENGVKGVRVWRVS